jgi:hypothetical protein
MQSESSIRTWGQLVFSYNAANERMDVEFVRVLKGDGTVVTATDITVSKLFIEVSTVIANGITGVHCRADCSTPTKVMDSKHA